MAEIIDTKICKPPQSYSGDKEGWRHFRTSLLGYVSALSPELKAMMQVAAELARARQELAEVKRLAEVAIAREEEQRAELLQKIHARHALATKHFAPQGVHVPQPCELRPEWTDEALELAEAYDVAVERQRLPPMRSRYP